MSSIVFFTRNKFTLVTSWKKKVERCISAEVMIGFWLLVAVLGGVSGSDPDAAFPAEGLKEDAMRRLEELLYNALKENDRAKRSEAEDSSDWESSCGKQPLQECPSLEKIVDPLSEVLELPGTKCPCPKCSGMPVASDSSAKKARSVDDEMTDDLIGSDDMESRVHSDKWRINAARYEAENPPSPPLNRHPVVEPVEGRHRFTCLATGQGHVDVDPEISSKIKIITEHEEEPSRGILKTLEGHEPRVLKEDL